MTRTQVSCVVGLAIICANCHSDAPTNVSAGAKMAQVRCHRLIHDDLDDFVACIEGLANDAGEPRRRLGILYFGWVGAFSAERTSIPGAEAAATRLRFAFRPEQLRLGLSDQALCTTIEGDCAARVARLTADEAPQGQ